MEISNQYFLMKEGKSYYIDEYLFERQHACAKQLAAINALPFGSVERERLFSELFANLGENCVIKENFHCNYGFNISIGSNCYLNFGISILDSFEVQIGNNVFIAPGVVISPVTHPNEAKNRRNLIGGKITIEDDVWIGANAVILTGVTIHRGAVIGAGALVKTDVPANTIFGGVPAHFIKTIDNTED